MGDIIRLEFKTINALREKISELRKNGYRISSWDYFHFLNENMNTIVADNGTEEYWLDYIGE